MSLMQVESSILKGRYWPFEIANNIFDGVFEVAKVVGNIILRKTWITDISSEYSRGLYEICNDGGILLLLSHCKKMERCICLRWERQKMLCIFSSSNPSVALEMYHKLMNISSLIRAIHRDAMLGELMTLVKEQPHWEDVHYAVSLGLDNYFEQELTNIDSARFWRNYMYIAELSALFDAFFIDFREEQLLEVSMCNMKVINLKSRPEGWTPLHLAVKAGNFKLLEKLIHLGGDIKAVDASDRNAFHLARKSNIIKLLANYLNPADLKVLVNQSDVNFMTPLHYAVREGTDAATQTLIQIGAKHSSSTPPFHLAIKMKNLSQIKCFLENDPSVLEEKDTLTGNTALHTTYDLKILRLLLNYVKNEATVNTLNNKAETPLLVQMQQSDSLSNIVALIAYGADVNASRYADHFTALHLAVTKQQLSYVKALFVFGADSSKVTKSGKTALQIALELEKRNQSDISREIVSCIETYEKRYQLQNFEFLQSSSELMQFDDWCKFTRMLNVKNVIQRFTDDSVMTENLISFDGGGIRGLITIQILMLIEQAVGSDWFKNFQWVAGSSTGCIIAVGLCLGYSLGRMQKLYFQLKDTVFCGTKPYSEEGLENVLKREFGTREMASVMPRKLIVTATNALTRPAKLKLFRSYPFPHSLQIAEEDMQNDNPPLPIWKVIRSSCAAPYYFPPLDGIYIDGGLMSNNPSLELMTEMNRMNTVMNFQKRKISNIGCFLSLGTGRTRTTEAYAPDFNSSWSIFDKLFHFKEFVTMLYTQCCQTDGCVVDRCRAWCESLGAAYFRLTPEINDLCLDETDDSRLIDACWETIRNHVLRLEMSTFITELQCSRSCGVSSGSKAANLSYEVELTTGMRDTIACLLGV
ncbi:85/88 kDa calcium-independent phospholipase A2 [Trichinella nelsoni]|uniref:phospholipase A2 n=1 Tax=Trichinella nelsoni TaxID=6336 RepID=A0A0V0SM50_9BILA|nr:85/88 kDa calcium-independent phospholipase A2 [Trichinella nelsoni]